jgi:hypothetical protein
MEASADPLSSDVVITVWRVVGPREHADILRLGDYNLSPNGSGKYFALTEAGARDFARNPFNRDRTLTLRHGSDRGDLT